jgi:hypothetical protein
MYEARPTCKRSMSRDCALICTALGTRKLTGNAYMSAHNLAYACTALEVRNMLRVIVVPFRLMSLFALLLCIFASVLTHILHIPPCINSTPYSAKRTLQQNRRDDRNFARSLGYH